MLFSRTEKTKVSQDFYLIFVVVKVILVMKVIVNAASHLSVEPSNKTKALTAMFHSWPSMDLDDVVVWSFGGGIF